MIRVKVIAEPRLVITRFLSKLYEFFLYFRNFTSARA